MLWVELAVACEVERWVLCDVAFVEYAVSVAVVVVVYLACVDDAVVVAVD